MHDTAIIQRLRPPVMTGTVIPTMGVRRPLIISYVLGWGVSKLHSFYNLGLNIRRILD